MKTVDRVSVLSALERIEAASLDVPAFEVEKLVIATLEPLLQADGYSIRSYFGFDLLAERQPSGKHPGEVLGIEIKHSTMHRPVSLDRFASQIVRALGSDIDRVIVYSTTDFTQQARQAVARDFPIQVELLSPDAIRAWLDRLTAAHENVGAEVREILSVVSRRFATLIARDPDALDEIEWRDLERVMAEVFEEVGFSVTLTPSAKDKGKDVVLECEVRGHQAVYLVEIKHWRSGARVGGKSLQNFLNVIVGESREGGLFLSTYGYCSNAFEQLSQIDRRRLRFGDQNKVVALCRSYVKASSGLWSPPEDLAEVLYEETI